VHVCGVGYRMNSSVLLVPVSPLHSIELAEGLRHLLEKPQEKDFPVYTIARKTAADGRELVHSELVIAGKKTRATYPLAELYPVHFLKSYHPWSYHGDPEIEFTNNKTAAEILDTPGPIGYDKNSFRTCFLPGKPLSKLSPFTGVEPPHRCLVLAEEANPLELIGLWKLVESVFSQIEKLHVRRFCHGDLELHNIVVCTSPVQTFLIDFEGAERSYSGSEKNWNEKRLGDCFELFRLAIYLQCGLGRQRGPLAEESQERLSRLFESSSTFAARLDQAGHSTVSARG
jgi:hypothetical protein